MAGLLFGPPEYHQAAARWSPLRLWEAVQARVTAALGWFVKTVYTPVLDRALHYRYATAALGLSTLAVTLSLFLMVPYFVFVFDFLDPENIISRIQVQAFAATSNIDRDVTVVCAP